ncbi:MAG: RNA polymerase sporulation sigma factor SigK [Clostridia bacterium]|jgi:RNA polymerase sporulation-specific sigma factor|nr:RNA polymerase sporulation sigma factor SigK [Clostridia bacterium]
MRKIRELLWKLKQKLSKKNGIYYINGPELLPAPYTPEREAEVIAALEAGDPDARTALIEHNLRLVVYIAKKFECTGTGIEDLISIGTIGLCKAVGTFRSDKNIKLATYASRCIENEILMHLRKQSGKGGEVSLDEPLNVDFDGNELLLSDILGSEEEGIVYEIEQREEREAIRRAVASLDERERLIIELRYGLGGREEMTQKEVATYLGISQSYISRLEKKIITELRDRMTNV